MLLPKSPIIYYGVTIGILMLPFLSDPHFPFLSLGFSFVLFAGCSVCSGDGDFSAFFDSLKTLTDKSFQSGVDS